MYCNNCEQNPCTCLKSTTPVFRSTYQHLPFGITREQFGAHLYEAIKRVGAIKQLQRYMSLLIEDPKGLTAMREREQEQRKELAALLPKLTDNEDAEFRYRYPEVLSW